MSKTLQKNDKNGHKLQNSAEESDIRLVLVATNDCCLKCEYCIVPKSHDFMSWETLKKSTDFLFTSKKKNLQIHFFGGEPLMMPFDLMKKVIVYAKLKAQRCGKNVNFMISTNGIPLNSEKIRFFSKFGVRLEFSIDGGPETQNHNRPQKGLQKASYHLVIKHLPETIKAGVPLHASAVITPSRARALVDDFLHLVNNLKFKEVFLMVACGLIWTDKDIEVFRNKLRELKPIYLKLLKERQIILYNIYEWLPPFRINTEVVIDTDGRVYPACCVVFLGDEKTKRKFVLGHIDKVAEEQKNTADDICKKRLSNDFGMRILIEGKALETNIKAGDAMTDFVKDLSEAVKKNPKLYGIYSRKEQKFEQI
ncbi:hypothetical protein A3C24_04050 [Candidatus Roizmanbacteria bacterium RIFCSPHIGHO2_02_FULL_37_24]|uniref:Radical SAM core domain-containing protein n=1 Tax=Candidatus Roizmanbacteria bacterium RIFCSPHIGHO2_02_FULL_37_24 TaxID=1802037 RepID=A0A1F7GV23_9BACT|nr:MAG: hypothetical protein A3C24_04050 [Candidatus Roizmanbacteria bacterium RIFCSPHIGHO2_02_FULL_37_24]HLD62028.1 radical SAM protein [Patescibacteria group bacterium]